jgi:glutamyl-tRNA reductase
MEEHSRSAADAETLIAAEVERFHLRQRTVSAAPAIVALQQQAEEIRQAELKRIQARLGTLSPEQSNAVEALTRALMNKFLHPPMQALKQAAREGDAARMDALCETWSLPTAAETIPPEPTDSASDDASEKAEQETVNQSNGVDQQ